MDEILTITNKIKGLIETNQIPSNLQYGIAGSYARGENTDNSDIDIVIKKGYLSLECIDIIESTLHKKTDILYLDLLKKEDEDLDNMLINMGLPINNDSVYKTVLKEVVWI